MIEEEFTNPFACSTSEAGRIPEFNLRVFEEEDLDDDDPDDEEPFAIRGWMPDYNLNHDEDEGRPIPESLRRELNNWSLGFNNEGPPN